MSKSHNIANLRSAVLDYIAVVTHYKAAAHLRYPHLSRYNMMHVHELYDEVRGRDMTVRMLIPYFHRASLACPFPLTSKIFKSVHTFAYFISSETGRKLYADG